MDTTKATDLIASERELLRVLDADAWMPTPGIRTLYEFPPPIDSLRCRLHRLEAGGFVESARVGPTAVWRLTERGARIAAADAALARIRAEKTGRRGRAP